MIRTIFTLVLLFISLISFTPSDKGITITVTINNVPNNNGHVLMSLHNSETFMKSQGVIDTKTPIEDGKVTVKFKNVIPGEYAILALHDSNNNQKMDFRDNGMPLEAFGASNNVMAMGPPQYDDAKFIVKGDNMTLNIRF